MGPMKLHFNFCDILLAPRLALSGKKIWVFLIGNLIGYAVYWILSMIAFLASGDSFTATWTVHGLYPCLFGSQVSSWFSWLLYSLGSIFWIFALSFSCTAVSRITYKQLKGDNFFSTGDAIKFVKKHWHPLALTVIAFTVIILVFLIGAVVFALFGKIPYVGEFLFVLPYLVYFFGAVFTIYTALVFLVSLDFTPIFVATYEEDTMGSVFQSYAITWSQPWRIITYFLILVPMMVISTSIFYFFWRMGFKLVSSVFGLNFLMGEKLHNIVNKAVDYICPVLFKTGNIIQTSASENVSAVILAFFLFILSLAVFSYALSVLTVGKTLMFVIFKKKSDDENLLERKDEDELAAEEEEGSEGSKSEIEPE